MKRKWNYHRKRKDKERDEDTAVDEIKDPDNEEFVLEDFMNDDDFDHERVTVAIPRRNSFILWLL